MANTYLIMKTNKISNFQKWMNKRFGYREDYEITLYKFLLEFCKRYIVYYWHYHDNYARTEFKKVKNYTTGTRSGKKSYIGSSMKLVTILAPEKKSYETFDLTFFWFTPFAIKFSFNWSNNIFFSCRLSFSILKPNIQFGLSFQRNTA